MYRNLQRACTVFLLVAGLSVGLWGCRAETEAPGSAPQAHLVPALRFAGVNLIYALRRVAAEANLLLALDEIQPRNLGPDLARFRIDLDLDAGPVSQALEKLKQETGAFDFMITDNVVYVRSQLTLDHVTGLDTKDLPATKLKVNIEDLGKWIMSNRPNSFLKVKRIRGEPIFRVVELELPEKSSVLDLLLLYAKKANRGWRIRRAGQWTPDPQGRIAIIASTVALWRPLDEPNIPSWSRRATSTLAALASVSKRTGTPICIKDRSPLGDVRGWLDYGKKIDPQTPARAAVGALAWGGVQHEEDDYTWEWLDGVIRVSSRFYSFNLPGQDLLNDTVTGGRFEGTLPELARWINENRSKPPTKVLMGGEITGKGPASKLEIAEGTTVEEALLDFARASGAGWNLVIVDALTPDASVRELPANAWLGAYLMPLESWAP